MNHDAYLHDSFCHALPAMSTLVAYNFGACLHSLANCFFVLKCASRCKQHVLVTCPAYIFLSVTPFGVCLICILTSFSCTLCLCHCFLLLTNLKYDLGQISTKSLNCCGALSDKHV